MYYCELTFTGAINYGSINIAPPKRRVVMPVGSTPRPNRWLKFFSFFFFNTHNTHAYNTHAHNTHAHTVTLYSRTPIVHTHNTHAHTHCTHTCTYTHTHTHTHTHTRTHAHTHTRGHQISAHASGKEAFSAASTYKPHTCIMHHKHKHTICVRKKSIINIKLLYSLGVKRPGKSK